MKTTTSKRIRLYILFSVLLITTGTAHAAILPSDDPNYEVMATGRNYTAYFSQFDTNGFTYTISGHHFSFLPRELLYTDNSGTTTLLLGRSHFTQLKNITDYIYFDNPYGLENQLQYLCNPLIVKEVVTSEGAILSDRVTFNVKKMVAADAAGKSKEYTSSRNRGE